MQKCLIAILLSCAELPLAVQNFPCLQLLDLTLVNAMKSVRIVLQLAFDLVR